jgi:Skp family chaperone for outer membrane proteins
LFFLFRELEAELNKHEALLNKMHEEMQQSQPVSSTYGTTTPTNVDKDKEEQLWAQQRLVTALKRKVFFLSEIIQFYF